MFGHGQNKRPSARPIEAGGLHVEKVIYQGSCGAKLARRVGQIDLLVARHRQYRQWHDLDFTLGSLVIMVKPVQVGSFLLLLHHEQTPSCPLWRFLDTVRLRRAGRVWLWVDIQVVGA